MTEPILARLILTRDAAKYLGLSERTLWAMAKDGRVPCVKIGKLKRFDIADLDAFINRCKQNGSGN
jgi:excisionase family DNA binding protein